MLKPLLCRNIYNNLHTLNTVITIFGHMNIKFNQYCFKSSKSKNINQLMNNFLMSHTNKILMKMHSIHTSYKLLWKKWTGHFFHLSFLDVGNVASFLTGHRYSRWRDSSMGRLKPSLHSRHWKGLWGLWCSRKCDWRELCNLYEDSQKRQAKGFSVVENSVKVVFCSLMPIRYLVSTVPRPLSYTSTGMW